MFVVKKMFFGNNDEMCMKKRERECRKNDTSRSLFLMLKCVRGSVRLIGAQVRFFATFWGWKGFTKKL